jgi:hypothetical protein
MRGPICYLCARPGHLGKFCPYDFCHKCQERGHRKGECENERKHVQLNDLKLCSLCLAINHTFENCPKSEIAKLEEELEDVHCVNCGKIGHLVSLKPFSTFTTHCFLGSLSRPHCFLGFPPSNTLFSWLKMFWSYARYVSRPIVHLKIVQNLKFYNLKKNQKMCIAWIAEELDTL